MYSHPARTTAPSLGSQVSKRWASSSSKPSPRKGRKGHLYGPTPSHPPPTPEEEVRITKRRMAKAERDERMDITLALTPVKTCALFYSNYFISRLMVLDRYMGGFTRPRDLRSSNWFPGGRYEVLGKVYESPPEAAYQPHTVYLLESRYPVRHGIGRVDAYDHVVGICREGDLEAVLRRYNSDRCPRTEKEAMDNARWPWQPQFHMKRTKWWGPDENPLDIITELYGSAVVDPAYISENGKFEAFEEGIEEDMDDPCQPRSKKERAKAAVSATFYPQYPLPGASPSGLDDIPQDIMGELSGNTVAAQAYVGEGGKFEDDMSDKKDTEGGIFYQPSSTIERRDVATSMLIASFPSIPSCIEQKRAFHSSTRNLGAHSYNEDHIVPDFYLQHKRRKNPDTTSNTPPTSSPSSATSQARQGAAIEHSLMEHLSDSILSDDIVASTMRRPKAKIPHEHFNEEGVLVHPSGYVIPTPGDAPVPMSEKRPRDLGKQTAAVAERVLEEGDYSDINAHTRLQDGKVPFEVIEEDGTVSHPSGFVPPTPQHQFKYSDSSSVDNHVQDAVQRQRRGAAVLHLSKEEMEERQRKSDAIFAREADDAELIAEVKAGVKEVAGKSNGSQQRGIHTSAVVCATEIPHTPFPVQEVDEETYSEYDRSPPPHLSGALLSKTKTLGKFPRAGKAPKVSQKGMLPNPPTPISEELQELRSTYMPTLADSPFWRPLLTITVSTRPIAVTLARLSRSHPRGLPFFASISNDDRKTRASYSDRMRNMRLNRMNSLSVQAAQLLAGARGGFIGIRFSANDRGRGIRGQGLEAPLPKEKRTIKIGVGNWYYRANEVKEAFREDAIAQVGEVGVGLKDIGETFEIAGLDDYGKRIDDKTGEIIPWRETKLLDDLDIMEEIDLEMMDAEESEEDTDDIVEAWRRATAKKREMKKKKQELAREHKYEIASHLVQKHRLVMEP